jgi:hypothetical protein
MSKQSGDECEALPAPHGSDAPHDHAPKQVHPPNARRDHTSLREQSGAEIIQKPQYPAGRAATKYCSQLNVTPSLTVPSCLYLKPLE